MRVSLLLLLAASMLASAVLAQQMDLGACAAPDRTTPAKVLEASDLGAGPTLSGVARGPRVTPAAGLDVGGCVGPEVEHPPRPFRLTVHVRHALTGQDVHASWNVKRDVPSCAGPPPGPPPTPEQQAERERDETEARRREEEAERRWQAAFVASGDALMLPEEWLDRDALSLALELPSGLVTLHEPKVEMREAAGAERYELVVPVVDEVVLEVRVTGPGGRPATSVSLDWLALGETSWPVRVEEQKGGVLRVHGLPHLAGEEVRMIVEADGDVEGEMASTEVEEDVQQEHVTQIPADRAAPWVLDARVAVWGRRCCDGFEWSISCGCRASREKPDEGTLGSVRLWLRDHTGARVGDRWTQDLELDESGTVLREGLPAGVSQACFLALPGHLRFEGLVDVVARETVAAELREPLGGRLDVEVVDPSGRALPGARLHLTGCWFDVAGGTARLDATTDDAGRRVLPRVQPGPLELRATWGGRTAEAEVEIRDGETTKVTLVAR